MVLISGKYKQAAGIVSKEVVVEHCAFTESPTSNWLVDVKCRSEGSDWKSLSKANPKAEVQMKTNDISITLPPLQEDTEIAVFGKPGKHDLKRMQMYVFGAKPVQGRKWMIYVYICDDTNMAFKNLCENEKRKGNKLLTAGAGLFVPNNNKNVSVELNALEPGWQIKGSSIKTVESRDVWNSPENATDFPSLCFEIHHVDKTRQSFFCAITASNETKATAEIMAVFKKEKETEGRHKECKRFHHQRDVKFRCGLEHSWWNGLGRFKVTAFLLVFLIIFSVTEKKQNTTTSAGTVELPCPKMQAPPRLQSMLFMLRTQSEELSGVEVKCPADSVMNTSECIPITARTQQRPDVKEGRKQSVIMLIKAFCDEESLESKKYEWWNGLRCLKKKGGLSWTFGDPIDVWVSGLLFLLILLSPSFLFVLPEYFLESTLHRDEESLESKKYELIYIANADEECSECLERKKYRVWINWPKRKPAFKEETGAMFFYTAKLIALVFVLVVVDYLDHSETGAMFFYTAKLLALVFVLVVLDYLDHSETGAMFFNTAKLLALVFVLVDLAYLDHSVMFSLLFVAVLTLFGLKVSNKDKTTVEAFDKPSLGSKKLCKNIIWIGKGSIPGKFKHCKLEPVKGPSIENSTKRHDWNEENFLN